MRFEAQVIGWFAAGIVSIVLSFLTPVYCSGVVRPALLCSPFSVHPNNFTYLGVLAIIIALWIAVMGDRIYELVMKRARKK